MSSRKRILIIGGTGFIGSNLVRFLAEKGNEVIVFHRKDSNLKNLENISFKSIMGDLADKQNIEQKLYDGMEECEIVYNLAACGSFLKKHYQLREIINKEAAGTVARIARELRVQRLIHVSSSSAVGYPKNGEIADESFVFNAHHEHYALTKYQGENEVLKQAEKGLNTVIGIPCSTVGPHGMKPEQFSTFKSIADGKMWMYPTGGLCITSINDLVRGLYLCCEKGTVGKRYILGGHNITYKQYFDEIAHVARAKVPNIPLPKAIMPWLGLGVEAVFNFLKKGVNINKDVAMLISEKLYYSSELAVKELGYTITNWKKTIRDTVNHLQTN